MKNIVITGISRGLGKCLFEGLTSEAVNLIAIGRHFTKEQKQTGTQLIEHDLGSNEDKYLEHLSRALTSEEIIFINNAGTVEPIGQIGNLDIESFSRAMQINCNGPVALINFLVAYCKKAGKKLTVVNISTGAAKRPIAGWAGYCSTKAAMRMFLDVLAEQERESGLVQIFHVDPGVMDTGMQVAIRASSEMDFPSVNEFVGYKKNGKLRIPMEVAQEVLKKYVI